MLACRGEFGVELWAQDYQSRMNPHLIRDKSFATEAGDDRNAAIFFFERYYQNDRKINELLLLAAHSVLMAGQLNPTGVGGLEIVTWREAEDRPKRLSESEIATLTKLSKSLDDNILSQIFPPITPPPSLPLQGNRSTD